MVSRFGNQKKSPQPPFLPRPAAFGSRSREKRGLREYVDFWLPNALTIQTCWMASTSGGQVKNSRCKETIEHESLAVRGYGFSFRISWENENSSVRFERGRIDIDTGDQREHSKKRPIGQLDMNGSCEYSKLFKKGEYASQKLHLGCFNPFGWFGKA